MQAEAPRAGWSAGRAGEASALASHRPPQARGALSQMAALTPTWKGTGVSIVSLSLARFCTHAQAFEARVGWGGL